jgi:nucleoid DNA-binding protein
MQLEPYISDLLYRYECVTIPDFGSFLTRRVSATIHESTYTFYPPKKILSFNEQIQKNDGLLAHYIADVEKIPYEAAIKKVQKRVKYLKSFLIEGETVDFHNIGSLSLNQEGKILFEPSYHLNYLTDAFGLGQFVSEDIKRETYKKSVEDIEKVIPLAVTSERRSSNALSNKRSYLKYAAVAFIALTIGGLGASKFYVDSINEHNQLAQEQANEQLEHKIQEATFVIDNPLPAVTLNVTKQSGNYHIIAGAFRIEENSDKKVSQLKEQGFKARKIGVNKYGLHEVVYASYEDRLEALEALRTIKRTHNADAWLLVKELDSPLN